MLKVYGKKIFGHKFATDILLAVVHFTFVV